MQTFLRETCELGYWSLFCPSRLQRRMNEWAPRAEKDEERPDTKYRNILLLNANSRFFAQFFVLACLHCLPLIVAIALYGEPIDWWLLPIVGIMTYSLSILFLPTGLHFPLFVAPIYTLST